MDASEEQLKHCEAHPNITFRQGCAESTGMPSHSVDLVTVATALHWCAHWWLFSTGDNGACMPTQTLCTARAAQKSTGLPLHRINFVTVATALHWYAHAKQVQCPSGITHDTYPAKPAEDHHESPHAMADMSGKRVIELLHPQCGLQDANPRRCYAIMLSPTAQV